MNINELKDYPPIDEKWADDKKEEYYRLIEVNKSLQDWLELTRMASKDPEFIKRKEEYLRVHPIH